MKKLAIIILFFAPIFCTAQEIAPAPADKSVVYFVRANSTGALINFTYFDSTKVIGKFNGPKYMRYECEPGEHLFWARSENRDFIMANLEAGKIYIVDVVPMMGAIKAGVMLVPVNSPDYKLKRIKKLLAKKPPETFHEKELEAHQFVMKDVMERGMNKLSGLDNNQLPVLGKLSFKPEELIYVKKQKKKNKKRK